MDIAPYIRELLNEQGQVCVPGLGLFIRRRIQGFYDATAGVLRPPTLKLELIEPVQVTSELTDFISQKKHISGASAGYFIRQFVDQLKVRLQSGEVKMDGLGILTGQDGQILLKNSGSVAGRFFGLEPFDPTQIAAPEKPVQKEQAVIIERSHQTEELIELPERRGVPSYVYWLLTILIALIAAGVAYYVHPEWFPFHQPKKQEQNKYATPVEQATATTTADTAQVQQDTSGQDAVAAKDTPAPAVANTRESASAATKKTPVKSASADTAQYEPLAYEIIGASFKTLSSARSQVERFGWKGVKAHVLKNTRGKRIKVSLGSFKDETSALMELKRIRAELNNKELFIEHYNQK